MNIILIICGWTLILDGFLSFLLVSDKKLFWQIGRAVRIIIGIIVLVEGI